MKRVLDYDPLTGVTTYFETDQENQKNLITYSQDIDPFLDFNKHMAGKLDKKEEYWYVGSIPDVIIMKWSHECGHKPYTKEWQEYAMKQLDSTEYRKFNQNKIKIGKRSTWQ